jgi:hypothetical protein
MTQQRNSGSEKSVRGLLLLPELRRPSRHDTPKITKPVRQRSLPNAPACPDTRIFDLKRPCPRAGTRQQERQHKSDGLYPPLPCWSGPVTRGVYPGSGPPLPTGWRSGAGSGQPMAPISNRYWAQTPRLRRQKAMTLTLYSRSWPSIPALFPRCQPFARWPATKNIIQNPM